MSDGKNKLFMKDPVAFMQKYAVAPANYLQSGDTHNSGYYGKTTQRMQTTAQTAPYEFNKVQTAYKIAYLNFEERPKGSTFSPQAPFVADEVMGLTGTYTPTKGKVKSYYLPWVDGGIVRLAIPAMGTSAAHDDVKYFFTAGISGCSIFVKGTTQAPEIYHAGGSTGTGTNSAAGAKFWRDLIDQYAGGTYEEVNKMNYISDPNSAGKQLATVHSETFETWLKAQTTNDLNIQMISPWGCVMGLRDDAGHWRFYLQENATIIHTKFKKKSMLSKQKVQTASTGSARPMLFRQFFPGGLAQVNFQPSMPRKI